MRFLLFYAFALLFFSGCVQYHYSPNFVQTPYVSQKGDGAVLAAVSGSPRSFNMDLHASYSPLKHTTVMLNYYQTQSSFEDFNGFFGTVYEQTSKGHLIEGAIGGYVPIAFGTGALYAGWGQGEMRNDFGLSRLSDLRLRRIFVQPTFTFKNKWFRLGMGMRLVRLTYPSGSVDYGIDQPDIEVIQSLERDAPIWFPELGGNIGLHFKPVTISANLVLVASSAVGKYGFDSSNIGVGVAVELQDLFKKQPSKTKAKPKKKK